MALQFFQEAKLLEAIKHPQIIELKEFYRTKSEKLVLILEFAEGGDLMQQIEASRDNHSKLEENTIIGELILKIRMWCLIYQKEGIFDLGRSQFSDSELVFAIF